jgi:hypothetical protein
MDTKNIYFGEEIKGPKAVPKIVLRSSLGENVFL